MKRGGILLINPGIINLVLFRLFRLGDIYFYEENSRISRVIVRNIIPFLRSLKINYFEYKVGMGDFGNGVVNSYLKATSDFVESYLKQGENEILLNTYNHTFNTKTFHVAWKKMMSEKSWNVLCVFNGLVHNYSSPCTVYVCKDSKESLLAKQFFPKYPHFKVRLRNYLNSPGTFESLAYYFIWLIYQNLKNIFAKKNIKQNKFKVLIEAINPEIRNIKAFSVMDWWDSSSIDRKDILFFSYGSKEPGRVEGIQRAKNMGFQCVSFKDLTIPIRNLREVVSLCLLFPLKNLQLLFRSKEIEFYLLALREFYKWKRLFSNYNIDCFMLPSSNTGYFQTIYSNYFGTKTILTTNSYHGSLESLSFKYTIANNFITWGKAQTYYIDTDGIDYIHYTGCYLLPYYDARKKNSLLLNKRINNKKSNIVFFDNKVVKDASSPESLCFRFYDLMIKASEKLDANIIFRTKYTNAFREEYYFDFDRAKSLEKMMNEAGIIFTNRSDYDFMSILSVSDIVVYNRVGTPTMIALLLDIPAFSFSDNIDDIPDPIIKHYVNEFAFEDQKLLIEKMEKVVNGKNPQKLAEKHKQLLNHYSDKKGLERYQKYIGDIINGLNVD